MNTTSALQLVRMKFIQAELNMSPAHFTLTAEILLRCIDAKGSPVNCEQYTVSMRPTVNVIKL